MDPPEPRAFALQSAAGAALVQGDLACPRGIVGLLAAPVGAEALPLDEGGDRLGQRVAGGEQQGGDDDHRHDPAPGPARPQPAVHPAVAALSRRA